MSYPLWFDALFILLLILASGVLAASEISIIAVRKSRIAQLTAKGVSGAGAVAALKEDPSRFLATVQIGITVVGALAAALGGEAAVRVIEPQLRATVPALGSYAGPIALGITVLVISYFSLVLGELVPKSLALRHSERLAIALARPVHRLSRLCAPAVHLLSVSSGAVLWLLRSEGRPEEAFISEDEVKHIIHEGAQRGVFDEAERELIHSVFEFTDTSVREVLVPRGDIHGIDINLTAEAALKDLAQTGFSRAPVYDGDLDHIVGIVHIKDLLRATAKEPSIGLRAILHPAHFVPDSMQISDLLREAQSRRLHMVIVLNELGTVIGLVTVEDLLEEIVGEIRDEFDTDEELPVQQLPDGSFLAEGSVPLNDLKEQYHLPVEESQDYHTLAGLVLARLKRIPRGGEVVTHQGLRMTVVATDGRRVRKVRIERAKGQTPHAA